jgi:hypothetical protein
MEAFGPRPVNPSEQVACQLSQTNIHLLSALPLQPNHPRVWEIYFSLLEIKNTEESSSIFLTSASDASASFSDEFANKGTASSSVSLQASFMRGARIIRIGHDQCPSSSQTVRWICVKHIWGLNTRNICSSWNSCDLDYGVCQQKCAGTKGHWYSLVDLAEIG